MSAWVVVPCLLSLRAEFDQLAPQRDRGADGTIGDAAHTSTSDHTPDEDSTALAGKDSDKRNEVHALDVDTTGPWPAARPFRTAFAAVIAGERAKWLSATDVCRLEYAIFDRQIYSRIRDFRPVPYTGKDPHTGHAHFSARYLTAAENDTRPWGVLPPSPPKETIVALELSTSVPLTPQAKEALGVTNDALPLQSILNLLLIHSARVSRNVLWAPGPVITETKTVATAAGAAAVAAREAVEALTHDPADGGNTAEQDSLKAALGL